MVNFTSSGLAGTAITYIFALTGKDKATIKGAGIGAMMWVGIAGLLTNLGLKVQSKKPATPLINLAEHIFFGALCGSIIAKMGQDSLFPDETVRDKEKVPVFYSGQD